jgi:MscS family membrane protein
MVASMSRRTCALAMVAVAVVLCLPSAAAAQPPSGLLPTQREAQPAPNTSSPAPVVEVPDSPRASLLAFAELAMRKGDYAGAARYLSLRAGELERGPELARQLRAVMERHLEIDADAISPDADGNTSDGLAAGVDRVGDVPDGSGGRDPVFVVRSRDASGTFWAFSPQTVSHITGWYDALPDRWVRDWMPQQLQRRGPAGLLWWQWMGLPALALFALAIGRVLGVITRRLLRRAFSRTAVTWDDELLARTSGVLTVFWALVAAAVLLPWLALLPGADQGVRSVLGGLATVTALWALWCAVDVWADHVMSRPWAADNPSARSLLSVVRNLAKVLVAVGGLIATLGAFGYPVGNVLAGLGIGGIALAFGAQKTVENLFGSIALAADQPFHVGDFVRIEDFTGNVERIGMRSTLIRTPDRTLISMPNGTLSELRIEDFAARDRMRFGTTLHLVHGTSEPQLLRVLRDIESLLRDGLQVWPDTVLVKLAGLSPASLDVEILCWFRTASMEEFWALRQTALLGIVRIVREAGTSFAVPTQTIQVTREDRLSPPGASDRDAPPVR